MEACPSAGSWETGQSVGCSFSPSEAQYLYSCCLIPRAPGRQQGRGVVHSSPRPEGVPWAKMDDDRFQFPSLWASPFPACRYPEFASAVTAGGNPNVPPGGRRTEAVGEPCRGNRGSQGGIWGGKGARCEDEGQMPGIFLVLGAYKVRKCTCDHRRNPGVPGWESPQRGKKREVLKASMRLITMGMLELNENEGINKSG